MVASGLSGEYSWAVSLCGSAGGTRIETAEAPASPTTEELATAEEWAAAAREGR